MSMYSKGKIALTNATNVISPPFLLSSSVKTKIDVFDLSHHCAQNKETTYK